MQVTDAGEYAVVVSNAGRSSTSQPATLTVNPVGGSPITRQITRQDSTFLVTLTVVPPVGTPVYCAVSISGQTNRSYQVEATEDPVTGPGELLALIPLTSGPRVFVDQESPTKTKRFYRSRRVE